VLPQYFLQAESFAGKEKAEQVLNMQSLFQQILANGTVGSSLSQGT
jgi:hypothetical protein